MSVFTVILSTSATTRCSKSPASMLEFVCWFLIKRLYVCFCLKQKFCWQWCDYYWGLGMRRNHLQNWKRHKIHKRWWRGRGGNEEYWQRMKSGWLTWKVNVCSVKVLMDWAALPFVCLHVCVCAREGRMVNAIVFAHVSVWTVTSRSMNMHACVHDILFAERLITPGWVIDVWSDWVLHPYELCTKMSCTKKNHKQTNKKKGYSLKWHCRISHNRLGILICSGILSDRRGEKKLQGEERFTDDELAQGLCRVAFFSLGEEHVCD